MSLSACSSGFQRFDSSIYNDALPQQSAQAQNPYPGSVDYTTTASAGRAGAPLPATAVGPAADPAGVYHQAEPTYAAPRYSQPTYTAPQPDYRSQVRQPYATYTPTQAAPQPTASSWGGTGTVSSSTLPRIEKALEESRPNSSTLNYTPPKPETSSEKVYIPADAPDATVKTASLGGSSGREAGWTGTGGTRLTVREGETLYNLSKRYGVPVDEIRRANGLTASQSLQAGQTILIPTYVYGPNAAISAPDNDPQTRAASAGLGYLGEADGSNIAVPTRKPQEYASISASGDVDQQIQRRYQPTTIVAPPDPEQTPDYGVVTGSVSSSYRVQSGDTLSSIAASHGTTVNALQKANGLSSTVIWVGQNLRVPSTIDSQTTASVTQVPPNVDPIVTGSVSTSSGKTATEISSGNSEYVAPEQTGISTFRWPVTGKVIEKFGQSVADGTNEGIDISVPEGTAVRSAENGVVIYAGNEISEYGNLILVRHADGWVSAYAHNRSFEVKKGDRVNRGQIIARSGKTGSAERPKLHFELRKESRAVDPLQHLT